MTSSDDVSSVTNGPDPYANGDDVGDFDGDELGLVVGGDELGLDVGDCEGGDVVSGGG